MTEKLRDELMNVHECADYLGIAVSTLRKMCHRKEIPHVHLGRFVRFYRPDIRKWVLSNKAV